MSASNPQQAQQLQKQQTILQQLNQQFEQQQSILQSEIQRQSFLLQQQQQKQNGQQQQAMGNQLSSMPGNLNSVNQLSNNDAKPPSSPSKTNESAQSMKRSSHGISGNDDDALRPNKMLKSDDSGDKTGQSNNGNSAENGSTAPIPNKKSPSDGNSDKVCSLIPTMPVPAIEQHLDSLVSSGQLTPRQIAQKCLPLVKKLINHEHGWVFKDAVDPVELGIPDYFDIVEHPMDLMLVSNKLEDGAYKDIASFERDTKLVFENAILFNGDDSDVGEMAKELLGIFATDLKDALKGEVRPNTHEHDFDHFVLCM